MGNDPLDFFDRNNVRNVLESSFMCDVDESKLYHYSNFHSNHPGFFTIPESEYQKLAESTILKAESVVDAKVSDKAKSLFFVRIVNGWGEHRLISPAQLERRLAVRLLSLLSFTFLILPVLFFVLLLGLLSSMFDSFCSFHRCDSHLIMENLLVLSFFRVDTVLNKFWRIVLSTPMGSVKMRLNKQALLIRGDFSPTQALRPIMTHVGPLSASMGEYGFQKTLLLPTELKGQWQLRIFWQRESFESLSLRVQNREKHLRLLFFHFICYMTFVVILCCCLFRNEVCQATQSSFDAQWQMEWFVCISLSLLLSSSFLFCCRSVLKMLFVTCLPVSRLSCCNWQEGGQARQNT